MNYDSARQRKDGKWDYTSSNDNSDTIHPMGYCAGFYEWSDNSIRNVFGGSKGRYEEYIMPHRKANEEGKYHTTGHDTKQEAKDCYKTYQLDFDLNFNDDQEKPNRLDKCEIDGCDNFTSGSGHLSSRYTIWNLCKEHRNRESVEQLFNVGESWHS